MLDMLLFGIVMVLGLMVAIGIIVIVLVTTVIEQYKKWINIIIERRRCRNLYR